jgi:hypothetical protein
MLNGRPIGFDFGVGCGGSIGLSSIWRASRTSAAVTWGLRGRIGSSSALPSPAR